MSSTSAFFSIFLLRGCVYRVYRGYALRDSDAGTRERQACSVRETAVIKCEAEPEALRCGEGEEALLHGSDLVTILRKL